MQSTENWLPVVGFEGLYEVSDSGQIRSLDRITATGQRRKGRILKLSKNQDGYLKACLSGKGSRKSVLAHHAVAAAFIGQRPDGLVVCHNNGNAFDNRSTNLRYDTVASNVQDSVEHGTHREARKTHCPNGHPLVGDNIAPSGQTRHRQCRACKYEGNSARDAGRGFSLGRADARFREIMEHGIAPSGAKQACIRGHAFEGRNLLVHTSRNGRVSRQCRACKYEARSAREQGRDFSNQSADDRYRQISFAAAFEGEQA